MGKTNFVLMIMYDISTLSEDNPKQYRQLYKYLHREGFYPLQASIHIKPLSEKKQAKKFIDEIGLFSFENAHIRSIILTHNAFLEIKCIMGEDSVIERLLKKPDGVLVL